MKPLHFQYIMLFLRFLLVAAFVGIAATVYSFEFSGYTLRFEGYIGYLNLVECQVKRRQLLAALKEYNAKGTATCVNK